MKKNNLKRISIKGIYFWCFVLLITFSTNIYSQQKDKCGKEPKKKAVKFFNDALVE